MSVPPAVPSVHTRCMALEEYRRKRDFTRTPEPRGDGAAPAPVRSAPGIAVSWDALPAGHRFCVQQHRATRMHFDLRLEHDGVLLSWAVPRGPSLDPAHKRLAVQTEDHPVDYGAFEGVIPSGYGAGTVLLWDIGTYRWVRESAENFDAARASGNYKFVLSGTKISGEYALVHIGERGRRYGGSSDASRNWLLIKKRDSSAVTGHEALEHEGSVLSGRSLDQIARDGGGDPRVMAREARQGRAPRAGAVMAGKRSRRPPPLEAPPAPMLATSITAPFSREGWFFELKWDGVRALAAVGGDRVLVAGRSGRDETSRYPELAALSAALRGRDAVVDGEIVVLDGDGRPSFERLQSRINIGRDSDVRRAVAAHPVHYVVFDLLRLDGRDLTGVPLRIRKKTLADTLRSVDGISYVDHVERDGEAFFAEVRRIGFEGMMCKRADSLYQSGRRSRDWLKVKAWQSQSCVIAGYTGGRGRRSQQVGALILGVYDGDLLVHAGQVGTGFAEATLTDLRRRFDAITTGHSPLSPSPATNQPATWVRPELVCEVRHAGWTRQGVMRHPSYLGLREDLSPRACHREQPQPTTAVLAAVAEHPVTDPGPPAPRARSRHRSRSRGPKGAHLLTGGDLLDRLARLGSPGNLEVEGHSLRLTNLDKVMWPEPGLTKRDLIAHYVRVSALLLPYLRDRPLSMHVFPDGIEGKHFWRKDKPPHAPAWVRSWTYHGEKVKDYVIVNDLATLVWVANSAVIDLHPWHSRIDAPDQPDWAVFDIDPAEGATFGSVVTLARMIGVALQHYGLRSALKTTGQTGLQVYVPIRRGPSYGEVRAWVEGVSRAVGSIVPELVSWEWTVSRRTGRVRLDYTQNIINKTLNAPYTVRATPRATVSVPIRWEELEEPGLQPDVWTVRSLAERLAAVGSDLFAVALAGDQTLPPLD